MVYLGSVFIDKFLGGCMRNWGMRHRGPIHRSDKAIGMSVKCMVFYKDKILVLQKQNRNGTTPWEFPGGGVEYGEDLKAAALREVREETGLMVEVLQVAGLWSFMRSDKTFLTGVIFVVEAMSDNVKLSNEHIDYQWVTPEELKTFELQESLEKALKQIMPTHQRGEELRNYFVKNFASS